MSETNKAPRRLAAAILAYSCTVLLGSIVIIINATMVPLAGAYQVDIARAGLLISCLGVGRFVTQAFCGALTDRLGRKAVMLSGMVIILVFFVCLPLSRSFWLSGALCVLVGVGFGFVNTASMALIYDCFAPAGKNAIAQSYVQLLFATGGVLTPLAANRLLSGGLYWGGLYWGCAVLTLVGLVATVLVTFPPSFARTATESGFVQEPKLRREGLLLCVMVFFIYSMGIVCTTWLPTLAAERIGSDATASILVLSLYNVGCIAGTLVFAQLLKRYHARRFIATNPAVAMVALSLCLLTRNAVLFGLGVFLAGATIAIVFNMSIGWGGEMFSTKAGTITGMISTASSASTLATPALTGPLLSSAGVRPAFATVYLLGVVGITLAVVLNVRYQRLKSAVAVH